MIVSFRHKGPERLYTPGTKRGAQAGHMPKPLRILSALDVAQGPDGLAGYWSIRVNGNWRVTFRFKDTDVELVGYQDYH